jgi:hypothetical protein
VAAESVVLGAVRLESVNLLVSSPCRFSFQFSPSSVQESFYRIVPLDQIKHQMQLHSVTYDNRGAAIRTPWAPRKLPAEALDLQVSYIGPGGYRGESRVIYDASADLRSSENCQSSRKLFGLRPVPARWWPVWWGDPEASPRPHMRPCLDLATGCLTIDWVLCSENNPGTQSQMLEQDVKHALMFPW